jgi:Putative DNA-binding domain
MPRASITDEEIALIKAMLGRGMKNKNIQFFFNRPDRAVNSGRITGIKDGNYGNSANISAATDAELDAFLLSRETASLVGSVRVPIVGKIPSPVYGPVDIETLQPMFEQDLNGVWRFKLGETDQHECKLNFGFTKAGLWLRAVAALANNKGGYIFFGVHDKEVTPLPGLDKSYAVAGMTDKVFENADPADFAMKIKSALDPTPSVQIAKISINEKMIGVIHVEPHASRPVISSCSMPDRLIEGEIYFRYPGQSTRIKYSDLRGIFDARDERARRDILPMVERLLALGPEKALITNLVDGTLEDGKHQIVIDPALVDQIKFVKEGDFTQTNGAPTLKLVGEVSVEGASSTPRIVRSNITSHAVLRNFLRGEKVAEPMQYLLHSAHANREWQPIWYYLDASKKTVDEAVELLQAEHASRPSHRDAAISRLKGKKKALKVSTGRPKHLLKEFADGTITPPTDDIEAQRFALAVQGLPDNQRELASFRDELLKCFDRAQSQSKTHKNLQGAIFRAACRLDELLCKPKNVVV